MEGVGVGKVGRGDDETGILLEGRVQSVAEEAQNARLAAAGASHDEQSVNVDKGSVGCVMVQREPKGV